MESFSHLKVEMEGRGAACSSQVYDESRPAYLLPAVRQSASLSWRPQTVLRPLCLPLVICMTTSRGVAAQACMPLCSLRSSEGQSSCHVSRDYTAALVEHHQGGPWADIAVQVKKCEAASKGDRDYLSREGRAECEKTPGCSFTEAAGCIVKREWALAKLASPPERGGAGLGPEKCGLLGEMLARGVECQTNADKSSCDFRALHRPEDGCGWNEALQRCDVSSNHMFSLASSRYKEQFARLNIVRGDCAKRERLGCLGNCKWQGGSEGRCTLSTLETLLSFTGEDCPFAIFFQRHFGCANLGNKTMCNGEQMPDGLPRCEWAKGMCQPHPMALEFDLLRSLGVDHPDLLRRTKEAQQTCFSASSDPQRCTRLCAPSLQAVASAASLRLSAAKVIAFFSTVPMAMLGT